MATLRPWIEYLKKRERELQAMHHDSAAQRFLRDSPVWQRLTMPTWQLGSSAASQLQSTVANMPEPPAISALGTWSVLQPQLQSTLSLFAKMQPPLFPAEQIQETGEIVAAISGPMFNKLKATLEPPKSTDDQTIQAALDRFSRALEDMPPEKARRWRAEFVATSILSECPAATDGMDADDTVEYIEDAMRLVLTVIEFWERWDPQAS